ncbi:MAG: hypothetical protein Kow0077_24090 [Anaerolineae bacterium]
MSSSEQSSAAERTLTRAQITYLLRVLVWLTALGVIMIVYGGDVYVLGMLAACGLGVFALGIAPGLIPDLVRYVVLMPFYLGGLIPLWQIIEAVWRWERDPVLQAVGTAAAYALAVFMLVRMPRRMRTPFVRWLPKGAIPDEEAEALRREAREREEAAKRAARERATREAKAAQTAKPQGRAGEKRKPFWRREKAQGAEASSPPASGGGWFRRKKAESAGNVMPSSTGESASGSKRRKPFWRREKAQGAEASSQPASGGGWFRRKKAETPAEASAPSPAYESKQPLWQRPSPEPEEASASGGSFVNPFYSDEEDDFPDTREGINRYGWAEEAEETGASSSVNPFYIDDEDEDTDGYDIYTASPSRSERANESDSGPSVGTPTDDLIEKIREMRRKQQRF